MVNLPRSKKTEKEKAGKQVLDTSHTGRRKKKASKPKPKPKVVGKGVGLHKSFSKRAIKMRTKNCVLRKAAMEQARLRCVEGGFGAAKYFDPKHPERRVANCTLELKDKCSLHRAIKRGHCVRNGEHRMLLKDFEEEDIACEVMKMAHSRKPLRWSEVGDLVIATIKKRGEATPRGRAFVASSTKGMEAVEKGRLDQKFCQQTKNDRSNDRFRHIVTPKVNNIDFTPIDHYTRSLAMIVGKFYATIITCSF